MSAVEVAEIVMEEINYSNSITSGSYFSFKHQTIKVSITIPN